MNGIEYSKLSAIEIKAIELIDLLNDCYSTMSNPIIKDLIKLDNDLFRLRSIEDKKKFKKNSLK